MNKLQRHYLFPLLFAFIALSSCATSSNSNIEDDEEGNNLNVKFEILLDGSFSNISLPNQLVIKNSKDWVRLLKIHGNANGIKKNKIDFDDNIVIAIFAGQQPSGGYSLNVTNIKRIDDNLFITVNFHQPAQNEKIGLALTQPFILLSTKRVDGKIIFLAPPSPK